MIKIENVDAFGWKAAIRGARNPMNSWEKSDSEFTFEDYEIGPEDLKLLKTLSKAGPDHGKYLRMIHVQMDITAPLYWWKEFSTYKVGTTANSCSTMHKIHDKPFTMDDFSMEHLNEDNQSVLEDLLLTLNRYRILYNRTKDKDDWWQMIQLLPSSYNQKRTLDLNYAVLKAMYHARKNHKLDEWRDFCKWIESLPYAMELVCEEVES